MFYTLHLRFTSNNVFASVLDKNKKPILVLTSKKLGFSGSRKTGTIAVSTLIDTVAASLEKLKISTIVVCLSGYTTITKTILHHLLKKNIFISTIVNTTPIPHNGCKAPVPVRK